MKNIIKLFILCFMIIFINSCQTTIDSDIETQNIDLQQYPNITFQMTALADGEIRDDEYLVNWEKFFYETYGIDITLRLALGEKNHSYMYNFSKRYIIKGEPGIYFVNSIYYKEFLTFALTNGLIIDISQYLVNNDYWKKVPFEYKDMYLEGGKVFGLANTSEPIAFGRSINKDWMATLDITQPSNIIELYRILSDFTYSDPDDNGINDTCGLKYNNPFDLIDIFNIHDCYLDFSRYDKNRRVITSISYNPNTSLYEDCMFNDEIFSVFDFINDMSIKNVIIMENKNIIAGSYYGEYRNNDKYIINDNIEGVNGNKILAFSHVTKSAGAYFFTSNLVEPENTVNAFFNIFYGSETGNDTASNGVLTPKENILVPIICEDLYNRNYQDEVENSDKVYYIYPNNQVLLPTRNLIYNPVDGGISTGNTYYSLFSQTTSQIIENDVIVEDVIIAYRDAANKMGVVDILDTLNRR